MLISHDGKVENSSLIMKRLYNKAIERKKPISCMIGLTFHCNLKCRMCAYSYPHGSIHCEKPIRFDEWKTLLLQLRDIGIVELGITGGEPLSHPDFREIYTFASSLGFKITLKANGTLLSDDLKNLFSEYVPDCTMITIYGGSPETYRDVTGSADAYDKVVDAIKFFNGLKTHLTVTQTMVKQNVHDIQKIFNLITPFGLKLNSCNDIHKHINPNVKTDYMDMRLTPAQRVCLSSNYICDAENALAEAEILEKEKYRREKRIPKSYNNTSEEKREAAYCFDALTGFFLDADGTMRYCQEYSTPPYYPLRDGILKSWEDMFSEMDKYFYNLDFCEDCEYKKYCKSNCPARMILNGIDTDSPDEYTCEYAFLNMIYKNEYMKTVERRTDKQNEEIHETDS